MTGTGTRPLRFLSLFAGVGGFDLPLTRLGMACVGQVELDPACRSVLARHFPEVPRHDDIRTTTTLVAHPRPAGSRSGLCRVPLPGPVGRRPPGRPRRSPLRAVLRPGRRP